MTSLKDFKTINHKLKKYTTLLKNWVKPKKRDFEIFIRTVIDS